MTSFIEELQPTSPVLCAFCRTATMPKVRLYDLSVLEECSEQDEPNGRFLVLCRRCSDGATLAEHPRLYIERYYSQGDVCPGAMPQCESCWHREGLVCNYPDRWKGGIVFAKAETLKDHGVTFHSMPGALTSPCDWPRCLSRVGVAAEPTA